MSLESFSRLKEYESLAKSQRELTREIEEQRKRIDTLSAKKDEKLAQLAKLKSEHSTLQLTLSEIDGKIREVSLQRQRWIDLGGEEAKRSQMEGELAALENSGLELLERIEGNASDRKETQIFLEGLGRTIEEISEEAGLEIRKHEAEIASIHRRLESIREELPPEFRSSLEKVLKKNMAHGPFTRIEQGSCLFCRYKISRSDESAIDMQKLLRHCPQCDRIFIPYGT